MFLEKEVKKEPNARVSLAIKIDKTGVNEAREEIIQDFTRKAKIPGFRKGKVPRNIILTRFSQEIKSETINTLVSKSLKQILTEDSFNPISEPVVTEFGELSPDQEFSFKAEFDIMPEINLGEYKGIESEKFVYKVDDEAVNNEIENLRERFATLESVDKTSSLGDYLLVDYEILDNNGSVKSKKVDQTIFLDKEQNQLVKQLTGLKKGGIKEVTLEETYKDQGKQKTYSTKLRLKVKDVKQKKLPELNDEFAMDISDTETMDELRIRIREELEKEANQLGEEKTKSELMNKIIQNNDFELPESLISEEIERILTDIAYSYRISPKKLMEDETKYREYKKQLRPNAINNIKKELLLMEIAKREDIEIKEEEIDEEIKNYVQKQKKDFQTVKNNLVQNRAIKTIEHRLKLARALEIIYKNGRFKDIKTLKYQGEEVQNQ